MSSIFFDNWAGLGRVLLISVFAYGTLVFLLRISGKRTLSKMNSFDLVITIALGSTLASVILSKQTALLEGILAFALLIFMQFIVTWTSVRYSGFKKLIKDEPRLLLHKGNFLRRAMRDERVTEEEIIAAVRARQVAELHDVEAVVLETDGTLSVIARGGTEQPSALRNVK